MTPDQIRAARSVIGMSGAEFAAALGVDHTTVRRWEMDPSRKTYRRPSGATVTAINLLVATHKKRAEQKRAMQTGVKT